MRTVGLLFPPAETPASLIVGGISILERQARQLRRAGIDVLFAVDVVPLTQLPDGVAAVTAATLVDQVQVGDRVCALAAGLVVDERAIAAVLAAPAPALLVCDAGVEGAAGVERLDALTFAGGVLTLPGTTLRTLAAGLGEWDLHSVLTRAVAGDPVTTRIEFSTLPIYAPNRRREIALLWSRPQTPDEARAVGETLIAASQKGCLDWPARFLHPLPENLLVRLMAPTRITPNMVTVGTGLIGVGAGVAFAAGWLWTGLILALVTGPLDGVDGKLARTRVEFSRWGDLEHLLDKLLEYGWYIAVAWHFSQVRGSMLVYAIAALIILPAIVEAVQGEFFRRVTGIQLDDAGTVERRIRLFAGRRNTFLWTWLPFAAFGFWFEGFVGIAVYSVVTTGMAQWRFYKRLSQYGRQHGDRIAANYQATSYTFLPRTGA
ncbi:CDP-alcohol phosphatidyltransferase family protein [Sandarakinorhabdus sp. DWP1-3-1]|uniref:CDP-alcohol phosphatidyltransferase family protein n=1 Tax=Sandarakinorhabdus sp. DWP1-3-1 TaxID=2804627 RepID=UPI003CE6869E